MNLKDIPANEPALVGAVATSLAALLAAYGFKVDAGTLAIGLTVGIVGVNWLVRRYVTPNAKLPPPAP
jgi:hypothetical protein